VEVHRDLRLLGIARLVALWPSMDRDVVALAGFAAMFVLMALRVPIGIAMGIAGLGGFTLLSGAGPAMNLLGNVPLSVLTDSS